MFEVPGFAFSNIQNITELHRFDQLVNTAMIDLASQASDVLAGSKKFKTKEANSPSFKRYTALYSAHRTCPPPIARDVFGAL